MSLFVGNVSRNVSTRALEDEFDKYGKCRVNHKGSYAFIEYDDEKDAEDAQAGLQGKNMGGLELVIEWSKKSGRYDPTTSKRPTKEKSDVKCYECGKRGHISRECTQRRGSRRSRSRSRSRDKKERNKGRRRTPSRSRSRSRSRRRSRSPVKPPSRRRNEYSEEREYRKRSPSSDRSPRYEKMKDRKPIEESYKKREASPAERENGTK